jgi:superfamily II DNA or RNA helicase
MLDLSEYEKAFGIKAFYPHQVYAFNQIVAESNLSRHVRACLYFPTGKGKTKTSLVMMALLGQTEVLVIAPPSTQPDWKAQAKLLGIEATVISHARFRMTDYKIRNADTAIIVDEFHLLGGRTSMGWKKFDRRIAPHLRAPFIICSATPSYNDAERVYCVHHVLDPQGAAGGYAQYQLEHCLLEVAYRGLPNVVGFKDYPDAASFLEALPGVYYMEDTANFTIVNHLHEVPAPPAWTTHNFDARTRLLMHSMMTRRVSWQKLHYLNDRGFLRQEVGEWLEDRIPHGAPSLIYCDKTSVAEPAFDWLEGMYSGVEILTGKTSKKRKEEIINNFRAGRILRLVATATLATGTDGLDKVCDTLLILQDTQDDSLRRQLIGRILPRGDADANKKVHIHRLVLPPTPTK